jgi:hypothetical protein
VNAAKLAVLPEYGCTFTPHLAPSRWKASSARLRHSSSSSSIHLRAHMSQPAGVLQGYEDNALVPAVVACTRVALRVLVSQNRPVSLHHRGRGQVLQRES